MVFCLRYSNIVVWFWCSDVLKVVFFVKVNFLCCTYLSSAFFEDVVWWAAVDVRFLWCMCIFCIWVCCCWFGFEKWKFDCCCWCMLCCIWFFVICLYSACVRVNAVRRRAGNKMLLFCLWWNLVMFCC